MKIAVVTGTRPQIIKTAPVLKEIEKTGEDLSFIHTGQHYDYELASQFISEFSVREPDYNLEVGSGTGVFQTAHILSRLSEVLEKENPDYVLVPGDTNSALGAALTGFKMDLPVCHLESGLRSFDMGMQEEINRRIIDHGAAALFAPTDTAVRNLEEENVIGSVFHVGDTMYDILKDRLDNFNAISHQEENLMDLDDFAVLTFHRRENVDVAEKLKGLVDSLSQLEHTIVFPIHPRTQQRMIDFGLEFSENVVLIAPVSYTRMMSLVVRASLLLTDSGGLQKEAYLLNTPCVTIRNNTEWIETLEAGANVLAAPTPEDIPRKAERMWGKKLNNDPSVYGDGEASKKITKILTSGEIAIKESYMIKD